MFVRDGFDPMWHLGVEDMLLDQDADFPPVLHLWRSLPAVVIGKNQIPWREANIGFLQESGIALCRRISGGGAVYHDPGNLNWSVCLPRVRYSSDAVNNACIEALAKAGITARLAGASSLTVDGAKVSGMAYAYRRDRVLHHGTLLLDADMDCLRNALCPISGEWITHAIPSIRMPVKNLGIHVGKIFQDTLLRSLQVFFPDCILLDGDSGGLRHQAVEKMKMLCRREWILGRTPTFEWGLATTEGRKIAEVKVVQGRIESGRRYESMAEYSLASGGWFGYPALTESGQVAAPELLPLGNPEEIGVQ